MNTHSRRLAETFANLRENKKKALIPFVTAGDPVGVAVENIMHALVQGGADIIGLGIPFSDPVADGDVIQQASERAIANGVSIETCLSALREFRKKDDTTPVALMGYLNSAEVYAGGFDGFAQALQSAGADAVIMVDLSYESGVKYRKTLRASDIDLINLIAPTTSKTRLGRIVKNAGGFVCYVPMPRTTDMTEIAAAVQRIKDKSDLPVCIGVSDVEMAQAVAVSVDGVVVDSALVERLYDAAQENRNVLAEATEYMVSLRHFLTN